MTYLVTFSCYGTHLQGAASGSYDHRRGRLAPDLRLERYHRSILAHPIYTLATAEERWVVRDEVLAVCRHRRWTLWALHVRVTHVHAVAEIPSAEAWQCLRDWKAYASRALNAREGVVRARWTHGGTLAELRDGVAVGRAIDYVMDGQGERLTVYSGLGESAAVGGSL